ncbi:hypothetical protein BKA64DRAFT_747144 [Cadophora sp. MPI-SDFR-AT-0126]|nr:hypothetical protein BKA64DRAFT_747144 [Leotiomycetes sp. MPI-SDFR-AT-0126]
MASIYSNSFLTVAAAKSSDSQGGLFSSAPPEHLGHPISYKTRLRKAIEIQVRHSLSHDAFWQSTDESKLPLFRRGWAYQERLLAPRVLNFTSNELVLECLEDSVCECSNITESYMRLIPFPKPEFTRSLESDNSRINLACANWNLMVACYSNLELTFESDKLPAISGIARRIQEVTNDTYLAGHWKSQLPRSLSWTSVQPATSGSRSRTSQWLAPSWSWVSVRGPVRFHGGHSDMDMDTADLICAGCETAPGKLIGGVTSGFIALSGSLLPLSSLELAGEMRAWSLAGFDDYQEAKNNFNERRTTLWMMPLYLHVEVAGTETYRHLGCIVLRETTTLVASVPNLDVVQIKKEIRDN